MPDPQNNPVALLSVPNDLEAAMVVSALAAHEVDATTSGSFTSGFRAEAPGEVSVLVRQRDLQRAREVLDQLDNQAAAETPDDISPQPAAPTNISRLSLVWWVLVATLAGLLLYS